MRLLIHGEQGCDKTQIRMFCHAEREDDNDDAKAKICQDACVGLGRIEAVNEIDFESLQYLNYDLKSLFDL